MSQIFPNINIEDIATHYTNQSDLERGAKALINLNLE